MKHEHAMLVVLGVLLLGLLQGEAAECDAINLPAGTVGDNRRGNACRSSTTLSSGSKATCDVKCDAGIGLSGVGKYTCDSSSKTPQRHLECQPQCKKITKEAVTSKADMESMGWRLDKITSEAAVPTCTSGWHGQPSASITMHGPGIVTVSFGNCGASGSVTLSVDDKALMPRAGNGEQQIIAFEIPNQAEVKLESNKGAVINVVKVALHCTGGVTSSKLVTETGYQCDDTTDKKDSAGPTDRAACEKSAQLPELPYYSYKTDSCISTGTCSKIKMASSFDTYVRHGWYLGAEDTSCTTTCNLVGLTCTPGGLMAHHAEVATAKQVFDLLKKMSAVKRISDKNEIKNMCTQFLQPHSPVKMGSECHMWPPGKPRALKDFDCKATFPGMRRLCWCAGPTVEIFNPACATKNGWYFIKRTSCDLTQCTRAQAGKYYSGPGAYEDSRCPTEDCKKGEPGTYFQKSWAISPTTCKMQSCATPGPGKQYLEFGPECKQEQCTNAPAGYYYTSKGKCTFAACINKPVLGFGYDKKGWSIDPNKCIVKPCSTLETLPIGHYFKAKCETAKCANAPVGHYYVRSGDVDGKCPFERCVTTVGKGFREGWSASKDGCPTKDCPALAAGYYYLAGSCTPLRCKGAKRGEYYKSAQDCENVGKCDSLAAKQYFVPGWSNTSSTCPVASCDKPLAPGFYSAGGCNIKECTKAPVGNYYTSAGTANDCSSKACTNAIPGEYYTDGFHTTADCPTKACDTKNLTKGFYLQIDYTKEEADRCQVKPCPPKLGHYFVSSVWVDEKCDGARKPCTNVRVGEKYKLPSELPPLVKDSCPIVECADAGAGLYYGKKGSCDARLTCTNKPPFTETESKRAAYNSSGDAKGVCSFKLCKSPEIGQTYLHQNATHARLVGAACDVTNCTSQAGYKFVDSGSCKDEKCPEDALQVGKYFALDPTDPRKNPCPQKPCTNRGNNKFVKGWSAEADKCKKEACPGPVPPCGFSTDSTDCIRLPCPVTTDAAPLPVAGIAAGVSSGVVVVIIIVVCVLILRKRNGGKPDPDPAVEMRNKMRHTTTTEKIALGAVNALALEDFILGANEVALGRRVAGGMGGQIFLGKFGMQEVALKESFEIIMNEYTDEFTKEATMMTKLRHPNIVQFFGIWEYADAEPRVFLVMEYCSGGDLHDAVNNPDNKLHDRLQWVQQVASAMSYLHSRSPPVIHRDMKAQNVLLDVHRVAKVGDFGSSKAVENGRDMTTGVGTVAYMSPEMMQRAENDATTMVVDGPKCDVFSFAVLSLYAVTGVMPHEGLDNKKIFLKVGMHAQRTPVPPGYFQADPEREDTYPEFVKVVERMWAENPDDRPPFDIILAELNDIFTTEMHGNSLQELGTSSSTNKGSDDDTRTPRDDTTSEEEDENNPPDPSASTQSMGDQPPESPQSVGDQPDPGESAQPVGEGN